MYFANFWQIYVYSCWFSANLYIFVPDLHAFLLWDQSHKNHFYGTGPLILGPVHLIWDRSPDSRNSIQFIYYSCEYVIMRFYIFEVFSISAQLCRPEAPSTWMLQKLSLSMWVNLLNFLRTICQLCVTCSSRDCFCGKGQSTTTTTIATKIWPLICLPWWSSLGWKSTFCWTSLSSKIAPSPHVLRKSSNRWSLSWTKERRRLRKRKLPWMLKWTNSSIFSTASASSFSAVKLVVLVTVSWRSIWVAAVPKISK